MPLYKINFTYNLYINIYLYFSSKISILQPQRILLQLYQEAMTQITIQ